MKKKLSKQELALKKIAAAQQAYVNDHIADIENPHGVTKTQIGLENVTNDAQVKRTEMGVAEGVATLDVNGKIPSSQLPTGNGDIIEGHFYNGGFYSVEQEEVDYVEIGGLKWATKNIGAENITDAGFYFQWGDTQGYTAEQVTGSSTPHKDFRWTDYKYGNGTSSPGETGMTKYNDTDGKRVLELEDDVAHVNMGGSWRMPTEAEFNELKENTNYEWTTINRVKGGKFTSKTDGTKYVFFPAAGYCYDGILRNKGSYGYVWSSTLNSSDVTHGMSLDFGNGYRNVDDFNVRRYGFSVRGVWDGQGTPIIEKLTQITPELEKIYVDIDSNELYRWNGTAWEKLGSNPDAALLGDPDGTAFSADFDPQTDTVWNKAQVLTSAQKAQVRQNLGLEETIYNTEYDPVNNKAATMADIPSIPQALPANGGNASTVNNHTVQSDVPANAVFTDTTYVFNTAYDETNNKVATMADIPGDATQSEAGLMSAADKIKLDNTRNITVSSSNPTSSDGENGDIWFVYTS